MPKKRKAPSRNEFERAVPAIGMKRFTIDVPAELHRRVKVACAARGQKMVDVLRALLEREFPAKR